MPEHADFMRRAIALATANVTAGRGGPFGAVVVRDGEIVAKGVNQVTASNDPTAHAEIVAIRHACQVLNTFSLAGCTLYSSCEPCPMCLTAILWARCDALYFGSTAGDASHAGFDDSLFYDQLRLPHAERTLKMENILRDEAKSSFDTWSSQTVKTPY